MQHQMARVIYKSKKGCMRDFKSLSWKLSLDLNNDNKMNILKLLQTCELLSYSNKWHMIFNLGPRVFMLGAYLAPWPFTQITNPEDGLNTCNFIVKGQWLVKSALSSHNHHHRPTQELNTNGWKYMNMDKFLHVSMKKIIFYSLP